MQCLSNLQQVGGYELFRIFILFELQARIMASYAFFQIYTVKQQSSIHFISSEMLLKYKFRAFATVLVSAFCQRVLLKSTYV